VGNHQTASTPEPLKPQGGRPRIDDRAALMGIVFVLKSDIPWEVLPKGIESSQKLGRHRWVVERTLAWLSKYQTFTIRYERRDDIHESFLHLGYSLICFNYFS
jgi:transposase